MADCPGVVHLASMADGGLARLRTPGGRVDARLLRAVAAASERLGSGVVDLTNRANLQIRGLAPDGGAELAADLEAAGFRFHGEADRRRNVLLDPFSGLDPAEIRDMRPLGQALDEALIAAPWIGGLSPKFSFGLDGGGGARIGAMASDVVALAVPEGIEISVGGRQVALTADETEALDVMIALAEAAASLGPSARAKDLFAGDPSDDGRDVSDPLPLVERVRVGVAQEGAPPASAELLRPPRVILNHPHPRPLPTRRRGEERSTLLPRFGAVSTNAPDVVALSLAAPVGRLDPAMLRFLADAAEDEGAGHAVLAPWSGVVLPGVAGQRAEVLLESAVSAGFTPVEVARRIAVVACAGAPSCERAREPAKALGAAVLALAAAEPSRLPEARTMLHLSACPKGCAGSAPADLLLLGESARDGWSLHRDASPRRPGPEAGRLDRPSPKDILALLAARG